MTVVRWIIAFYLILAVIAIPFVLGLCRAAALADLDPADLDDDVCPDCERPAAILTLDGYVCWCGNTWRTP